MPRRDNLGPEHPNTPTQRAEQPAQTQDKPVSVIEIVSKSSALQGMKVCEVTATAVEDSADLRMFVHQVREADIDDHYVSDGSEEEDDEEDAVPVMAGERARRFSDLPPEFDSETGPASRRQRTTYGADKEAEEATTGKRKTKAPFPRAPCKPIRLMAGREKFDFVGAFRDSPVTDLNWGSFFDLAPSVKRDICRQLVQERTCTNGKGKGKGKKVTIEEVQDEQQVSAMATDRDLGDVVNFFTKGVIRTEQGTYRISRILVDAGSVVNLMPIHLLRFIGAKLRKAGGMVIRTATNGLAKISYFTDGHITIGGVSCDLRVYALSEEYKPTYPLLLSRRWLQAVKAKGDYASGRYYIIVTGLFLSNKNTIGPAVDLLGLVLREASRDQW